MSEILNIINESINKCKNLYEVSTLELLNTYNVEFKSGISSLDLNDYIALSTK